MPHFMHFQFDCRYFVVYFFLAFATSFDASIKMKRKKWKMQGKEGLVEVRMRIFFCMRMGTTIVC